MWTVVWLTGADSPDDGPSSGRPGPFVTDDRRSGQAAAVAASAPGRARRGPRRGRRRPRGRSAPRAPRRGRRPGRARCAAGTKTSVRPARWAASSFCFTPPIGQHPAVEGDLAGHADLGAHRAAGGQRGQRGDHRDAGGRAVLGYGAGRARARGSAWSKNAGSTPSSAACARTKDSAICADSFITSPSWPVRVSPAVAGRRGPRPR